MFQCDINDAPVDIGNCVAPGESCGKRYVQCI